MGCAESPFVPFSSYSFWPFGRIPLRPIIVVKFRISPGRIALEILKAQRRCLEFRVALLSDQSIAQACKQLGFPQLGYIWVSVGRVNRQVDSPKGIIGGNRPAPSLSGHRGPGWTSTSVCVPKRMCGDPVNRTLPRISKSRFPRKTVQIRLLHGSLKKLGS